MSKCDKECIVLGACIGILMCVLLVGLVICGMYTTQVYSQWKSEQYAQKQAQIAADNARIAAENARIAAIEAEGTANCNELGYESYNRIKDICYTEHKLETSSYTYEYEELSTN